MIFYDHALLAQGNKSIKMLILEHAIKKVFGFYLVKAGASDCDGLLLPAFPFGNVEEYAFEV